MIPWFQLTVIDLGFLKIHIWGVLVSLGFIAGMVVAYFEFKKRKLETGRVFDFAFWLILGAVLGARLLYVIENFSAFVEAPLILFKLWYGGMSIYGGFIGALAAGLIYIKRNRLDFWQYADALIFSLPVGLFIGRIACFLIHEHPGSKTAFFLGVAFPDGVRHDLGLYLSLNGLMMFLVFLFLHRKKRFPGFYVALFSTWYGVVRFLLDFLRTKEVVLGMASDPRYFGLTLAQYFSIVLFIVGIYLFYKLKKQYSKQ